MAKKWVFLQGTVVLNNQVFQMKYIHLPQGPFTLQVINNWTLEICLNTFPIPSLKFSGLLALMPHNILVTCTKVLSWKTLLLAKWFIYLERDPFNTHFYKKNYWLLLKRSNLWLFVLILWNNWVQEKEVICLGCLQNYHLTVKL